MTAHTCACTLGEVEPLPKTVFQLQHEGVEAFQFLQRAAQIGKVVVSVPLRQTRECGDGCYVCRAAQAHWALWWRAGWWSKARDT